MYAEQIAKTLHPLERKVLNSLKKTQNFDEIVKDSGLKEVEVMRALQWMKNKGILTLKEDVKEIIDLGSNGRRYLEQGLPEKRFLKAVKEKLLTVEEIKNTARLSDEEVNISIGALREKGAVNVSDKISITNKGRDLLENGFLEEVFLKKDFPIDKKSLKPEEELVLQHLKKRKDIIKIKTVKTVKVKLMPTGETILKSSIEHTESIEALTPKIIKTKTWQKKGFRAYDIKADVPKIFPGKRHHYRSFLDEVREKFLALGFKERTGPIVETDFWNMDALFMPQFHSARDIHSAYYIKEPRYAKSLPKGLVDNVRKSHEYGYTTGSKGWRYKFDVKRTRRLLLRTQDTAISPKTLSSPDLEIPGKYFHIVRCFRHDVIDATHLADFYQTGGFVVEEGLNFRHLTGLLKLFAKEFANTEKIKIIPSYFPFTEPSAALLAKHPQAGWVELAGSGIFRPEMTLPLGVKTPVIAWGLGVERLAMFKLGIKDIRELFSQDLNFLRNVKMV